MQISSLGTPCEITIQVMVFCLDFSSIGTLGTNINEIVI